MLIQTQSTQQVKVDQIQNHALHVCMFMRLNRYIILVICEK
jgi:hypothetical protein